MISMPSLNHFTVGCGRPRTLHIAVRPELVMFTVLAGERVGRSHSGCSEMEINTKMKHDF